MRKRDTYAMLVASVVILGLPDAGAAQGLSTEAPIRLQAGTFLPSKGEPHMTAGLRLAGFAPNVRGTYIVQFAGPVEDAWKDAVAAAGGELLDYIPEFAFKVRMTSAQAGDVRRLAPVRWVGFFHPAYKLSPRLKRGGERLYTVRLEPGTDGAAASGAITTAGAGVSSREGGILVVSADEARLEALARILDVAWIENFEVREKHNEYAGQIIGAPTAWATGVGYDGSTQTVAVADTGLGGGTAATAHADIPASRITSIFNWPGTTNTCFQSILNDGARDVDTGHGTHVSGSVLGGGNAAGKGKGTAPGAHLVFQAVENWVTTTALCKLLGLPDAYYLAGIPTDVRTLFQQAYTAGARIQSNSWGSGTTSTYTTDSQNLDDYVWNHRDATVTFSAGNAGVDADASGGVDPKSLADQATAKNVVTVGASENDRAADYACDTSLGSTCTAQGGQNTIFTYGSAWPTSFPAVPLSTDPSAGNAEQMAAFSSRGATSDGRLKPDVVAPGTWVLSTYSDLFQQGYDPAPNPQDGLYQYPGWGLPPSSGYKYMGGTSMSNPLVAGGAAVVRDYYQKAHAHSASAALVKATLINSAVDLLDEDNDGVNNNALPIPNVFEGWGRVNLGAAVDGSRAFRDEGPALSTGGSVAYTYSVAAGTPLKVSLVWTDRPAATTAFKFLVNDLDLEVLSPGGVLYKGNAFAVSSGGWTIPNSGVPDRANNVENVYVQSPAAGNWTITVRAFNVPMGPQNFALAVAGQSVHPVYALTVNTPTHGTITSEDGFINCGTAGGPCTHSYGDGTNVPLSALPDPGYALSAWSGECSGTAGCTVSMSQPRTIGATFALAALPSLTINDVTITEGNCGQKAAVFTVSLSAPTSLIVTVPYATADGSATTSDQDYVPTSGMLVFSPNVTAQAISVWIKGDTPAEPDESFSVTLGAPTNATLADAGGTGTILNDDAPLLSGEELVSWTNLVRAEACGAALTKTAPTGQWDGGAASTRAVGAGGGYAEFTLPADTGGYVMFGLSNGDANQLFSDIDYAFYLYPAGGGVTIFEKGISIGGFGSYSPGDKLRLSLESGQVLYWKNGLLLRTSSQPPVYPLRVDTSLFTQGATIPTAVLSGDLVDVWGTGGEAVLWTNAVRVSLSGGNPTKTAPTGFWDAGASSTRAVGAGGGYAEFTLPANTGGYVMFGLSNGDTNQTFSDIDYAFYLYPAGAGVNIYEQGVSIGSYGTYSAGDKLRITVESGQVSYWRNGLLLRTSGRNPTYPLRVDTSLFTQGATIPSAVLSGNVVDVWATGGEPVVWTNLVGVSTPGGILTKTRATGQWDAGASSTRAVGAGGGFAEFSLPASTGGYVMFGLGNGDSSQSFTEIDYAFYLYPAGGAVVVYENGVSVASYGTYSPGDKLRITVESGQVKYWRNGVLLRTSGQSPTYPLRVDTSLFTQGATIPSAVLSGDLSNP